MHWNSGPRRYEGRSSRCEAIDLRYGLVDTVIRGRTARGALVLALTAGMLLPMAALADTEPLEFDRKGVQGRGPDDFMWGAMARDRDDLRRLWDRYNQRGPLPVIRFRKNVAVLAGSGGSSSCPLRLHDLRLNREHERIVVRMYMSDGVCTDDWRPRTFTVAVARSDLEPLPVRDVQVRPRRIDEPD